MEWIFNLNGLMLNLNGKDSSLYPSQRIQVCVYQVQNRNQLRNHWNYQNYKKPKLFERTEAKVSSQTLNQTHTQTNENFARFDLKLIFASEQATYTWHYNETERRKEYCMESVSLQSNKKSLKQQTVDKLWTDSYLKNEMDQEIFDIVDLLFIS